MADPAEVAARAAAEGELEGLLAQLHQLGMVDETAEMIMRENVALDPRRALQLARLWRPQIVTKKVAEAEEAAAVVVALREAKAALVAEPKPFIKELKTASWVKKGWDPAKEARMWKEVRRLQDEVVPFDPEIDKAIKRAGYLRGVADAELERPPLPPEPEPEPELKSSKKGGAVCHRTPASYTHSH
jgi:hypothetical protein